METTNQKPEPEERYWQPAAREWVAESANAQADEIRALQRHNGIGDDSQGAQLPDIEK